MYEGTLIGLKCTSIVMLSYLTLSLGWGYSRRKMSYLSMSYIFGYWAEVFTTLHPDLTFNQGIKSSVSVTDNGSMTAPTWKLTLHIASRLSHFRVHVGLNSVDKRICKVKRTEKLLIVIVQHALCISRYPRWAKSRGKVPGKNPPGKSKSGSHPFKDLTFNGGIGITIKETWEFVLDYKFTT